MNKKETNYAEEIASKYLDPYMFFDKDQPMWQDIIRAMKEYGNTLLDVAAGEAEATLEIISDECNAAWQGRQTFEEGVDYEVPVLRQSILKLKNEI